MSSKSTAVSQAFRSLTGGFLAIGLFSLAINIMMLAGPLYMMQVYDRVLTSNSMETLIALSLLLGGIFIAGGLLDFVRMRILNRLGSRFEARAGGAVFEAVMRRRVHGTAESGDNVSADLTAFRDFLSGSTLVAFFDAPWVPIYLAVLFLLHPLLGLLGLCGAVFLFLLAIINDAFSRNPIQRTAFERQRSDGVLAMCERNSESIHAMGMADNMRKRWSLLQWVAGLSKTSATDRVSTFTVISKYFRLALQSAMLGLGAALAISGEATAGVMIAATIILSRALAPVDQAIGQWRTFTAAAGSYVKLKRLLTDFPAPRRSMSLPDARYSLDVSIQMAGPPSAERASLSAIRFSLKAGDVLAVIGPSGSGKSTLARMLVGVWKPQRGEVRLDGVATGKWNAEDLGNQVGYLPQDVELFEGTVRENIARFSDQTDDAAVLHAARLADVHDMIMQFPDGYDTKIGPDGQFLSGGQRQRIGLARALYGDPFVLVLDEPNSNLDATGDAALRRAVADARDRKAVVVVMTHRPSTLEAVDTVLVMENGRQRAFGPKEDVLRATTKAIASDPDTPGSVTPLPRRTHA
ncbi:MAG: type I secretion system permease/ATPase [Pseudomonadota bacterium]